MKLAIIFPFYRSIDSPFDGPPLSTPLLLGGIKDVFSDVSIVQIDLNQELLIAVRGDKFSKQEYGKARKDVKTLLSRYSPLTRSVRGRGHNYRQMSDNRLASDCYIPADKDVNPFKDFFEKLTDLARLDNFDHYFLTIYKAQEPDIISSILLARFLKNKFPRKNIIYGGLRNYTRAVYKNIKRLSFIDTLVIGGGERPMKEIIKDLKHGHALKNIYNIPPRLKEKLTAPDYKSFRNLDYFRYKKKEIGKFYNINIDHGVVGDMLFIPYKFTHGCFWGRCKYCASSGHENKFYVKSVDEIIKDLRRLKKDCETSYFIFYNNNFNSDKSFSKKLLKAFIKNKLNIIWTDSFNLVNLDDELIELLARAGCVRMDIGTATLNRKLQKFYNNILQNNKYLNNLRKIHNQGIWVDINIIANLPYSYSVKDEIKFLEQYVSYIDAATLNSYRAYHSEMVVNADKYGLKRADERVPVGNAVAPMFFIEDEYSDMARRKKIFAKNYLDWHKFFVKNEIILNQKLFYLLGSLYGAYGHKNKAKIKKLMLVASNQKYLYNNEI